MKIFTRGLAFCSALLALGIGLLPTLLPERLKIYGSIHEGKPIPQGTLSFFGQDSKIALSKSVYYYFPKSADRDCDCTIAKESIAKRGGHLEVIDSKISKYFGIPIIHNGLNFQLADSLLIVVGSNGLVQSIYRGVNQVHLITGMGTANPIPRLLDRLVYRWNQAILASEEISNFTGQLAAKLERKF